MATLVTYVLPIAAASWPEQPQLNFPTPLGSFPWKTFPRPPPAIPKGPGNVSISIEKAQFKCRVGRSGRDSGRREN